MKYVRNLSSVALVALAIGASAGHVQAQSLADVAKKEAERREAIKEPVKTYTNSDLAKLPPVIGPSGSAGADSAPTGDANSSTDPKAAASDKKDKDKPEPVKDQKYWSSRMKELQAQLDRDQNFADALQSQINGLTADFAARDDPSQRAQIGRDRQKAIDEQTRLKAAIVNDRKAISDLEEEARKAGVSPGWLRS